MTESPETVVKRLLRPSEEVKIALEAERIAIEDPDSNTNQADDHPVDGVSEQPSYAQSSQDRKIIAAVVHFDSVTGDEQACLFCVSQSPLGSATNPQYVIEHAFPICDGLSIAMAQSRWATIDLSAGLSSPASPQSKTELTLTIHSNYNSNTEPLVLVTRDTQRLRSLLAEWKRLRDISVTNSEPSGKPVYSWILPYTSLPSPDILSTIPQDLRHIVRPVHELLTDVCAGSSTPAADILDISVIREDWIRSRIHHHCDALASGGQKTSLRLRVGTFNVNGKLPSQDLSTWVQSRSDLPRYIPPLEEVSPFAVDSLVQNPLDATDGFNSSFKNATAEDPTLSATSSGPSTVTLVSDERVPEESEIPDLIVLGFQELDLSAGALLYSTEKTREDAWFTAVLAGLGEKAELYEKLASKQLVGMLLIVLVKRRLKTSFTQAQTSSIGAGLMGLMGNKGGTAIRLTYTPPSTSQTPTPRSVVLTFVNSHLAASDEMYEKRNTNFHDLSKRLSFDSGVPMHEQGNQESPGASYTAPLSVYQTDALFWLGDLNYRINLPDSDIRTLLTHEQHRSLNVPALLMHDQLNLAQSMRKAFIHFKEHPITHLPSYRFNSDAASDILGYDSKRKPAWTDRVLHMCAYAARVKQLSYGSHAEITMSDHKPVSADFDIDIPVVDMADLDQFVHRLWKEVASIENSEISPQLVVEPPSIEFGKIRYKQVDRKVLQVRNIGKIASTFRFVPLAPRVDIHPRWLRIEPLAGFVPPSEHVDVVLSVNVDDREAASLNLKDAHVEALLILHTSLGKDHFISVDGIWERTCFSTTLERLNRISGPVRSNSKPELLPEDQAATAPKEVVRLVGWIMDNGSEVRDLFLTPGDEELVCSIRECLDTGTDLPLPSADTASKVRLCLSVAQCLLQLLDSLPDALAPVALHSRCATVSDRDEAFNLLNEFPSAAVNVWIAVTSLLHYICQHHSKSSQEQRDPAEKLAAVFAPILFRHTVTDSSPSPSIVGKRAFVKCFIS